ncbi:hypothetical protein K3495_g2453 [Podosphaera aphanis]|nr:hypothetical protein K3495_g2453 [Podosphaera aphanis]
MDQPQKPPSAPSSKRSIRDPCIQVKVLHNAGMNQSNIAAQLNISRKQVGYSLCRGLVTSKKVRCRTPSPSSEDVDEIQKIVKESPENRQMTYFELANGPFKHLGVSERVIKSELKKRSFKRHPALNKPTTSPEIRRKRREWAGAQLIGPLSNGCPPFGQMKLGQQMATIRDAGLPERLVSYCSA